MNDDRQILYSKLNKVSEIMNNISRLNANGELVRTFEECIIELSNLSYQMAKYITQICNHHAEIYVEVDMEQCEQPQQQQ